MALKPMVSRVMMPSPNARPVEHHPGLVLVGVAPSDGFPGLVLIWDEAENNQGASATNSIETVLLWLADRWVGFPLHDAVLVERDSEGAFDHAYPKWQSGGRLTAPLIEWRPLRWVGAAPRTREAFEGLFGASARAALAAVEQVVNNS